MEPIRKGDRGPAVEDVQRRLLALGEDLGATGVDGVFLGATYSAVVDFQRRRGLDEDGVVGPATWAALVDESFSLGDRLLYLRLPHFHGADVLELQGALNALGFTCGEPDGIFGAYAERAVREFQANTGLTADGIAGPDTVRALVNLRHVWADKPPAAPDALKKAPARAVEALASLDLAVSPLDEAGRAVGERLANLAAAGKTPVSVAVGRDAAEGGVTLQIGACARAGETGGPVVSAGEGGPALSNRMGIALTSADRLPGVVDIVLDGPCEGEQALQSIAVGLLDGLCLGVAASGRPVLP